MRTNMTQMTMVRVSFYYKSLYVTPEGCGLASFPRQPVLTRAAFWDLLYAAHADYSADSCSTQRRSSVSARLGSGVSSVYGLPSARRSGHSAVGSGVCHSVVSFLDKRHEGRESHFFVRSHCVLHRGCRGVSPPHCLCMRRTKLLKLLWRKRVRTRQTCTLLLFTKG